MPEPLQPFQNELMRIKGNGNVTIGVTTPATGYKLTVAGKIMYRIACNYNHSRIMCLKRITSSKH